MSTTVVGIRVPDELLAVIKAQAAQEERPLAQVVVRALRERFQPVTGVTVVTPKAERKEEPAAGGGCKECGGIGKMHQKGCSRGH